MKSNPISFQLRSGTCLAALALLGLMLATAAPQMKSALSNTSSGGKVLLVDGPNLPPQPPTQQQPPKSVA